MNLTRKITGEIELPGDKSISHRAAMFAAMAEGASRIENFSTAADCASTLKCLQKLGVSIERSGSTVVVRGVGKNGFTPPTEPLDCENSGTTARLLAGILAGQNFDSTLTGDESLTKRPMRRVIEPLEQMGVFVESERGFLPLTIHGKGALLPISYKTPVASAQVKSCVLLAGLNAEGKTEVFEKTATRDHTERMLRWFGAPVEEQSDGEGKRIAVAGNSRLQARDFSVPADVSSAAFFLVAAASLAGSDLRLKNVGLNPSRRAVVDVLRRLGARIEIENEREESSEPRADLRVFGAERFAANSVNVLRGAEIAILIDELPILAVFGTRLENGLEIRDAAELRVKESDRIKAVVENLKKMGANVEEYNDGLRVQKSELRGAVVDSFGDHRIAMSFAVAALFAAGETRIENAECVNISFPEFFELLESVTQK